MKKTPECSRRSTGRQRKRLGHQRRKDEDWCEETIGCLSSHMQAITKSRFLHTGIRTKSRKMAKQDCKSYHNEGLCASIVGIQCQTHRTGMTQVSPLMMPLSGRLYSFPELNGQTFFGLPGLLADSLPDRFGTKLISRYLAEQGRSIDMLTAVNRWETYAGDALVPEPEMEEIRRAIRNQ